MTTSTRILWIKGSPRGSSSLSSVCGAAFIEAVAAERPIEVTHFDVWDDELPEFGREAAFAKFAPILGEERTDEQAQIWREIERHIADVRAHDVVLLSSPMWNWSVPYRVKQWIDIVTQPMLSFTVDSDRRHVGVLGVGRRMQLILTRSSAYDGRSPEMQDHQRPYLEYLFGDMLGYALGPTIVIEPTTAFKPEKRQAILDAAIVAASEAGRTFATEP